MKNFLAMLVLLFPVVMLGQIAIRGKVIDIESQETLAFANVIISATQGTITDAEGNFFIEIEEGLKQFEISYIGYEDKVVLLKPGKTYYSIKLKPTAESLETVIISGKYVNPAIALMKRFIKQKSKNDYRNKVEKYSYIKYYKFLVSVDRDSIDDRLDSIFHNGKFAKIDSSMFNTKKYLKDKDMFVMESVMKVNGVSGTEKSKVIASRTAGFKNPMYEMLALQVSNQNVYDDNYKFLIKEYLGPLTSLSLKQYKYEIDDSISMQGRKVYILSYKNTKKPLISGKIYMDKESLAIAKMTLNTFEQFELQTTHNFKYYPVEETWFPTEAQMHIKKASKKDELSLDGIIKITQGSENDSISHSNRNSIVDFVYANSKTLFTELKFGRLHSDKIKYNLQVASDARTKPNEFWRKYKDSTQLNRDLNTYQFIDSITEEGGFEAQIEKFRKLSKGYYAIGPIDVNFTNLIDKNEYEGYSFSIGGKTNEKLSNRFNLAAYLAYGLKDKEFKYHGRIDYKLAHITQTYLFASYTKDLRPTATFPQNEVGFLNGSLSYTSYDKFYMGTAYKLGASHLLSNTLKATLAFENQDIAVQHPVQALGRIEYPNTTVTSAKIGLAYQPYSKFFLSAQGRQVLKEGFPKFYLNIEKTLDLFGNEHDFYRVDFQSSYKKTYLNKQYSEAHLRIGYASKGTSLTHLYSPISKGFKDQNLDWYEQIHLRIDAGFETMNNLEFADNFVTSINLQHTFSAVKLSEKYNFDIRLIGNAAWGSSYSTNRYLGIQSLEKGYFESGIELNKLYRFYGFGMGLGAYYRLGAYAYDTPIDNFTFRITISPPNLF